MSRVIFKLKYFGSNAHCLLPYEKVGELNHLLKSSVQKIFSHHMGYLVQ